MFGLICFVSFRLPKPANSCSRINTTSSRSDDPPSIRRLSSFPPPRWGAAVVQCHRHISRRSAGDRLEIELAFKSGGCICLTVSCAGGGAMGGGGIWSETRTGTLQSIQESRRRYLNKEVSVQYVSPRSVCCAESSFLAAPCKSHCFLSYFFVCIGFFFLPSDLLFASSGVLGNIWELRYVSHNLGLHAYALFFFHYVRTSLVIFQLPVFVTSILQPAV